MKPAVAFAVVIAFLVGVVVGQFAPLEEWFGLEENADQPSLSEAFVNLFEQMRGVTPEEVPVPDAQAGDTAPDDPGTTATPEPPPAINPRDIEGQVWQIARMVNGTTFDIVRGERSLRVALVGVPTRYRDLRTLGPEVRNIWEKLPGRYVHIVLTEGIGVTDDGRVLAMIYLLPNHQAGDPLHRDYNLNEIISIDR